MWSWDVIFVPFSEKVTCNPNFIKVYFTLGGSLPFAAHFLCIPNPLGIHSDFLTVTPRSSEILKHFRMEMGQSHTEEE